MPDKKNTAKPQEAAKGPLIYIGPGIPGAAAHGTIYSNGIPEQLEAAAREEPAIRKLIAGPGELAAIRRQLKDEESAASACYARASAYAAGRGE